MQENNGTVRQNPRILYSNSQFRSLFARLQSGDCIIGRLNLKRCEEPIFLDLVERGIRLFPSALSQQISRSKCLQAAVYKELMLRGTRVIRCRHDLVKTIEDYGELGIEAVITKQDRLDCGLGINLWENIENVFNMHCFGSLDFPFVVQPFIEGARDIRVILLGDLYSEAYWRSNPWSFRNNLHFGGTSGTIELSREQEDICRRIMDRGKFPYAHIDLLVTPDDRTFMSEVNLHGGIRGASISPSDYAKTIETIHMNHAGQVEQQGTVLPFAHTSPE